MKPYSSIVCIFILTLSHLSVLGHTEETKELSNSSTNQTHFTSLNEAWVSIQNSTKKIEDCLTSKNLVQIHEWQEKLSNDLNDLKLHSPRVIDDKAKRLEAALKQAQTVSSNLHKAADEKLSDIANREFEKLKSVLKLIEVQYSKEELYPTNASHSHTTHTENSTDSSGIIITAKLSRDQLKIGEKAEAIIQLRKKNDVPILLDDLKEVHTKKIHLLIIDSSLTDYHHEHPTPTQNPGEYQFSFIPKKPGSYRVWADIVPTETDKEEYLIADLPAGTKGKPITDRELTSVAKVDNLTFTLSFIEPLKVGKAALGKLKITDEKGKIFTQLEPVMGAYAHIVGFSEDYKTIAHIHPMGEEPTKDSDRGIGELEFHLIPKKNGLLRLFAQVRINGEDKFARFTLFIPTESD